MLLTQSSPSHPSQGPKASAAVVRTRWTRPHGADESGFSLIELLVVILIIGILAAIAIPSFLADKQKSYNAQGIEMARTAETTAETIATEHDGSYKLVEPAELHSIEPTIALATGATGAYLSSASGASNEYTLTVVAPNKVSFAISRNQAGKVSRTCQSPAGTNFCAGAESSSW